MKRYRGILFDLYHFESQIHLWIITPDGKRLMFRDTSYPEIYIHGPDPIVKKFIRRLIELEVLASPPIREFKKLFYENRSVPVIRLKILKPSFLQTIKRKLYAFYGRMDIFHSDIELPTAYMNEKNIHPMGQVEIEVDPWEQDPNPATDHSTPGPRVRSIRCLDSIEAIHYPIPDFRILRMGFLLGHRVGFASENTLRLSFNNRIMDLPGNDRGQIIQNLNRIIQNFDPDILLTSFGDETILPGLFQAAQKLRLPLHLDRDNRPAVNRRIVTKGTSYNTYGSWIYMAPSYPLFGRWHIDVTNSFVYKESELGGVMELSRISRIPVQKLARSSTGAALTSIETRVAMGMNYLVPWQKSAVESPKTAYELLLADKGGLVFTPDVRDGFVHERVVQIDFSQMYPSIMDLHNLSPETVNCDCCQENQAAPVVPETGMRVCVQRRGVVSDALKHILERRAYYKKKIKSGNPAEREMYEPRQNSLKWMLVTSFGYLGYRNAKFGRIESHESVTAIGREKILLAKEIAEENGFLVLHAITDCLFIKEDPDEQPPREAGSPRRSDDRSLSLLLERVRFLCQKIEKRTGIPIDTDGVFDWIVFLPARSDPALPVMNRYFGRFSDGTLKTRGIASRRKDTPLAIARSQERILQTMQSARSIQELHSLHGQIDQIFGDELKKLKTLTNWRELTLRKTVSKNLEDYQVKTATVDTLEDLADMGHTLSPGEKVRYVKLQQRRNSKKAISEERANLKYKTRSPDVDFPYYEKMLRGAFREVWEYFAPIYYFNELEDGQGRFSFRHGF